MKSEFLIIRLTEKEKLEIKKQARPYPSTSHYVLSAVGKAWHFRDLLDQAKRIEQTANVKPIALKVILK